MLSSRSLRRSALATIAVLTFVVGGCADSSTSDGDGTGGAGSSAGADVTTTTFVFPADEVVDMTGQPTVVIEAIDNSLEPRYVEISEGTQVVWKNIGRNPHDILPAVEGAFASASAAEMPAGASHIVVFDEPGDYPYYCSTHGTMKNGMNGAIRVVAEG